MGILSIYNKDNRKPFTKGKGWVQDNEATQTKEEPDMKHRTHPRMLCLMLSIVMVIGLLSGCGSRGGRRNEDTVSRSAQSRERETVREEKKEETRETEAPKKKDNELPSFLEFARGSDFEISQFDIHEGYFTIIYKSGDASDLAYAEDYIAMMLDEHNCAILVEDGKDRDDWYLKKLLLDHPYNASKHRMEVLDDFWDHVGDLFLRINYYKDDGEVYFNITYSEDLIMEDAKNAPGPGPSPNPGDKDCTWCGGDGRCNECGGDGRVYTWLPGTTTYVDQNCTNCNRGSCRQCGGSGKQ